MLFEGSVWFTGTLRCSNCQSKRTNPEERSEHPLAGGVPLFFPRQLSERCLFLQSRLWDLKEPMLSWCPKPMSMWPTRSHSVPWPFPIAFSKSIAWKIALLSSPEALETASKLCAYKQFQPDKNAIPVSGSQDMKPVTRSWRERGQGRGSKCCGGKGGSGSWDASWAPWHPVGWDGIYPSEATQGLFLPPSLLQRACKLPECGSPLLHRTFSLILLFFPSFSHLAHPLTLQHLYWRWIYSSGGDKELGRLQKDSPWASRLVICWLFSIWWQNSS